MPTHKLYCYVDETGQDTKGSYFIVAVVVTDNRQHELEDQLEAVEAASGKKTAKWLKTSDKVRLAYFQMILENHSLPAMVYAKRFAGASGDFDELEVLATAQAINMYREEQGIDVTGYKVTVTVDGLSKTTALRMGSEFRKLGIKTRKVVGKKDESSAIIRLADAVAGLVREVSEGRTTYKTLEAAMIETRKLYEL